MVVGEFTQEADLVVIGGGPAGYTTAFRAAELGITTVLVETRPRLGGVCLHEGCVPSKTLAHVAETIATARRASAWGVEFGPPTIDAARLRAWTSETIDRLARGLEGVRKQRDVEVIQGRACFEDSRRLAVRDSTVPRIRFRRAVIATGSRPLPHPNLPADHPRVITADTAMGLADVPARLLVVGDGYHALETAGIYAALGSRVTIAGAAERPLPDADADLVRPLVANLREQNITWHGATTVTGFSDGSDGATVTWDGAKPPAESAFDLIITACGRAANVEGLELQGTKVTLDAEGFIVVDDQMKTADARIMAVGDITGPPLLADRALHQGRIAAEVAAGWNSADDARAIPTAIFTDPQIAWCGLTETQAKAEGIPHVVVKVPWGASGRAVGMGRPQGLTKIIHDPDTKQVLGAGFAGPGAAELVGEASLAVEMGAELDDLAGTIHPHPTVCELLADAARS